MGNSFALLFAAVAIALAIATLLNARFVSQFGMRRISHAAMCAYFIINLTHLIVIETMGENLMVFLAFMFATFFTLGLIGPNATALAMEPQGHNAGAASAANGFVGTTIAALIAVIVGRLYDGTTTPLIAGFVTLGAIAIIVTLWTEKGRLFHAGESYQ
ncbi:MAG: hypothetical protein R3C58_11785 [Parvularculaceae bacterium]